MADAEKEAMAVRALEQNERALSSRDNVVGLGVVSAGDRNDPDAVAVAVYVTAKKKPEDLDPDQRIPASLEVDLHGKKHRVATRVIEQGEIEAEEIKPE